MQTFIMIAGAVIAVLGQKLNSNPHVPTKFVKPALAVAGACLYLAVEQPAHGADAFFAWLDHAAIWAAALPGIASLAGLAPGMATSAQEKPNA